MVSETVPSKSSNDANRFAVEMSKLARDYVDMAVRWGRGGEAIQGEERRLGPETTTVNKRVMAG